MSSQAVRSPTRSAMAAMVSALFASAAGAQNTAAIEAQQLSAQKVQVGTQLAIVSKTLADEQFIDGDRQAARRSYDAAAGAVLQALANPKLLTAETMATLLLLQRDIDYRRVLIDAQLPFWGLEFTSTADIPVLRMNELEALAAKLKVLNEEIQMLAERLKTVQLAQLKTESDYRHQEVESDIAQLEQMKGEINTEFHEKARTDAYGRVARLQVLQEELAQQQREAEAGIKGLDQKNQQLVLDGLSAASGVPASVTNAIATGNVNEALKQAAMSYAGSPEFSALLSKAKGVAPAVAKLYEQAKTIADKANKDLDLARKIANTVREPSFDNLAALGGRLVERMPADQRAALEKALVDAKPVGMLLSAAKKEGAILEAIGRQVSGQGDSVVREAIGLLATEHSDLRKWYGDVLGKVSEVTSNSPAFSNAVVDQVFRNWSKGFVASLPPQAVAALQVHMQIATADALAQALAARGAAAIPAFTLAAGKMDIPSLGISVDLAAQLRSIAPVDLPDLDVSSLNQQFGELISVGGDGIMKTLLRGTSQYGLESVTAVVARGRTSAEVFDSMFSSLDTSAKAAAAGAMAEIEAGRQVAHAQVEAVGAAGASGMRSVQGEQPKPSELDAAKQLLAGPLAAVFPGAAVAVKVAEFIGNNFEMGRLSDKIQKASDQVNRYVEEEMHLRRLIEQSQTNEALAKVDTDIAKLHRMQAASDIKFMKATSDALAETEDDLRKKIVGYRMSHFFFVAEELRLQYAQLSRSLSLWLGATPGPRDYLQERVRNDPRRLRLAVDPHVRAFDIFDLDQQRQRQDIDKLTNYWDFVVTQIKSFCTSLNAGCAPDTPSLGIIGSTESISLRSALTGEWEQFARWQQSQSQQPFTFALLVRPGLHQIELDSYKLGARVVHAMLTRSRPGATDERASTISVTHPGFSFIPTPAGFGSEVLAPETRDSLDPISRMESNHWYENRWGGGTFTRREFEGHGLFTVWMIRIQPAQVNYELTDIQMRFVYQYVPTTKLPMSLASLNPNAVEVLAAETASPTRMTLNSLAMLGDRGALDSFVKTWQSGQGSAATIKWKHGTLGSAIVSQAPYDNELLRAAAVLSESN